MLTRSFRVTLGTRLSAQSTRISGNVMLSLPVMDVIEGFLLLKLGSSDVILGITWLETLREVRMDWKVMKMKFKARVPL